MENTPHIETVEERGQLQLPLSALFVGGRLVLHSALRVKRYIEVRLDGDNLIIVAGKYIGLIPINQNYSVHVRPKVPVRNLVSILRTAREEPEILAGLETMYGSAQDVNLFELLIHALARELRELEVGGLHREFVRQEYTGSDFRGRLLLSQTLRRNWSHGIFHQAHFSDFAFSRDNAINRAIRYTIWHALRTYPQVSSDADPRVLQELDNSLVAFSRVALDYNRTFLPTLRSWVREGNIPDSRGYLRRLLQVCLMLLDDLGVQFDDFAGRDVILPSMVINMEDIFQKYLFYSVRASLRRDLGLTLWNTAVRNQLPLFSPPDRLVPAGFPIAIPIEEKAKPDFVVSDGKKPFLVCDAKYTTSRHREQVYQVVSHALAYNVRDALLLYPANNRAEEGCQCIGNVGSVRVFSYHYPLDAADLGQATSRLITEIASIIENIGLS